MKTDITLTTNRTLFDVTICNKRIECFGYDNKTVLLESVFDGVCRKGVLEYIVRMEYEEETVKGEVSSNIINNSSTFSPDCS